MSEMVGLAEIAQRLRLDLRTVRRLLAKEGDALQIEIVRGKGDKLLLSRDDAEKLVTSYEARRGQLPFQESNPIRPRTIAMATS